MKERNLLGAKCRQTFIRDQGLENLELFCSLLFDFLCFIVLSLLTIFFFLLSCVHG